MFKLSESSHYTKNFSGCAGSLRELTLTGLPQLQHLKVTQQLPRSEPSVTVKCKALRLPYSLLSFHLTVSTPSMELGEQLSVLANLPRLESVGLHGPLLEKIPALPTTVTRYRLSACSEAVELSLAPSLLLLPSLQMPPS